MNDENFILFGQRVNNERRRLGFTQEQIAEKCGITRVQWGRYERGQNQIGGKILEIFLTLGADLNYLFTGEYSKSSTENLSTEEIQLLNLFKTANVKAKQTAIQVLELGQ